MTYQGEPPAWQPPPQGAPANYEPPQPTQQLPPAAYQYTAPPGQPAPPQPRAPRGKRTGVSWWLVPLVVGVVALIIGIAIGSAGKSSTKAASDTKAITTPTATVRVTVATTVTASPAPAIKTSAAPTTSAAAAPPPATAQKVLSIAGNGIKNSANFTVTQDQWTIAYSFNCAAFGTTGNFIITVNDSTGRGDFAKSGVDELAAKGNDSTVEHGSGTYSLSINSECSWNVDVIG